METNYLAIIVDLLVAFGLAIAFVYSLGIVWRTEKRLDLSYKSITIAIAALLVSKIIIFISFKSSSITTDISKILEIIFIIFLISGIWEMRHLIRKLDGEK